MATSLSGRLVLLIPLRENVLKVLSLQALEVGGGDPSSLNNNKLWKVGKDWRCQGLWCGLETKGRVQIWV